MRKRKLFKGTVSVILGDHLRKQENVRFTMVPFKPLANHQYQRTPYVSP